MKVVVTGATGLLGARVVALLVEGGNEVVAVSRSGANPLASTDGASRAVRIDTAAIDLSDERAVESLRALLAPGSALVHLAALRAPNGPPKNGRAALVEVNVQGTLRVFDAVRVSGSEMSVIVYASCAEAHGARAAGTDHAVTKAAGEDHAVSFAFEQGARVAVLRFPPLRGNVRETSVADDRESGALAVRDAARAVRTAVEAKYKGIYDVAEGGLLRLLQSL